MEGRDAFFADSKSQDAVLRNLQTLAESTQHLSDKLRADHPDISWRRIAGLRNVLVHDYLGINLARVWEIIERELPRVKSKVETLLGENDDGCSS